MRSSSRSNCAGTAAWLAAAYLLLASCAAPAPDLPRRVVQTSEPGYGLTSATAVSPPGAPAAAAPSASSALADKPIALVASEAWAALTAEERSRVEATNEVRVLKPSEYGTIIDVQGENQSTAGSNTGAAIGGAVAGAAYIDHSVDSGKYSALGQLAITALGAAAGSAADTGPRSQYQFRYTIKQGDGDIRYYDEVKATSFRHSVGVCVVLPSLTLISTQVCQQTPKSLRKRYLAASP